MKKLAGILLSFVLLSSSVLAKDMRFAQVTDVRYSANGDNLILSKVIEDINKQSEIEFVVFTGDNINRANKDDLKSFLKELKNLNCPYYIVLGDRDVNRRKELSKNEYAQFVHRYGKQKQKTPNYTFEKNKVVFMVADGSKDVIPSTIGYYKDDVLEWVDANLDLNNNKPVIILQHFPLIPPAEKESYYTFRPENYLEILNKHRNVLAVISGHFGVNKEETHDGTLHISTAPIPYYRIIDILNIDSSQPSIWAQVKKAE